MIAAVHRLAVVARAAAAAETGDRSREQRAEGANRDQRAETGDERRKKWAHSESKKQREQTETREQREMHRDRSHSLSCSHTRDRR
jgi:hypothetical protein